MTNIQILNNKDMNKKYELLLQLPFVVVVCITMYVLGLTCMITGGITSDRLHRIMLDLKKIQFQLNVFNDSFYDTNM